MWVQDDERKLVRIFLWKKDDPYFSGEPHSARDLENAWRYYIASYTSIDDTEGVDRSLVSPVILFRNLHAIGADPKADNFPLSFAASATTEATGSSSSDLEAQGGDGTIAPSVENPANTTSSTSEAVGNKLLNRFLASKNSEQLTLRIAVNNYHPIFTPNTAEGFSMVRKEREGGEDGVRGVEGVEGEREGGVRERFLLMNEGMRGLSREEVEGRNGGWSGLVGDGSVAEGGKVVGEGKLGEGEAEGEKEEGKGEVDAGKEDVEMAE